MPSAVFFEEKQINAPWMGWSAVFVSVGLLAVVLLELSNRWHNTGSFAELIAGALGVVLIGGTVAWLAFTHHLMVSIDKEGISYTFAPSFYEPKRISSADIESFELRKLLTSELFASSKSSKWLKGDAATKEVCVVGGWMVVDFQLKSGRHVILGTHNPDGMLWALKRLQYKS